MGEVYEALSGKIELVKLFAEAVDYSQLHKNIHATFAFLCCKRMLHQNVVSTSIDFVSDALIGRLGLRPRLV